MQLDCRGKILDLEYPQVMGILNVTPDSFSDGGQYQRLDSALYHAEEMIQEGAAIIDIGGESTRPGAPFVGVEEELERVIPVIEKLTARFETPISIDTSKARVMREAVQAGASMINDVTALQGDDALTAAADLAVPICLMHMRGTPRSMQNNPCYDDVIGEITSFFEERLAACEAVGVLRSQLLLDPGFGFGKTLMHNQQLLAGLDRLTKIGLPLLVGISRKSMIGAMLDDATVEQRLYGSIAAAVMAFERGAKVVRVHDVKPTMDALRVVARVLARDA